MFSFKVFRESEVLKDCGIDDGHTLHMLGRLRGGAVHKNQNHNRRKTKADKQQSELERQ